MCYLTQCNAEDFIKNLFGQKGVEAALHRLDRLTQDEARTTIAQILKVVYALVQDKNVVTEGEQIRSACYSLSVERPFLRNPSR